MSEEQHKMTLEEAIDFVVENDRQKSPIGKMIAGYKAEIDQLQRKLDIAVEALREIKDIKYGYMDNGWPAGVAREALKQLEEHI